MKSTLTNKLLQHLLKKKEDGGFTLIELLVVIIIIGILAAIALPAFLNQANRARQSEATTYVGSINRGQQAYRLENRTFADQIDRLGLGIQAETEFYVYGDGSSDTATNTVDNLGGGDLGNSVFVSARPLDSALLSYTGATYTLLDSANNATTTAVLCVANAPGSGTIPVLTLNSPNTQDTNVTATNTNTEACL
ncbi:MAG: type IV pilin-like G/H family protein [Nodosilinea sp.]